MPNKLGLIARYSFNVVVGIYAFVFLTMFAYLTFINGEGALSCLIAASLCMLAIRLTDIKVFALGKDGLRTELERTIEDVQVTLAEFKRMAELWARIASKHAYSSTVLEGLKRSEADEFASQIVGFLTDIGSKEGVHEVTNTAQKYWRWIYGYRISAALLQITQETDLRTRITDFAAEKHSAIEWADFVKRNAVTGKEVQETIDDLAHYERHMAHRHPEQVDT